MEKHGVFSTLIKEVNSYVCYVRKRPELIEICRENKCVLRLENSTRWSSTFLMLRVLSKAFKRKALDQVDIECPINEDLVDQYLKVLKPIYLFNIGLQFNNSSIADVSLTVYLS